MTYETACRHKAQNSDCAPAKPSANSATPNTVEFSHAALADRLGLEIRIAHYPPYCSKHNPIEHRLFPHITRACQGVVFHTVEVVKDYMEKAYTTTGLKVVVGILDGIYQTGKKCADGFKKTMKIVFDELLPRWNYEAIPQ